MTNTAVDFFAFASRALTEYLRSAFKPSDKEFALWLDQPKEIYQRVRGTAYEALFSPAMARCRAGILVAMRNLNEPEKWGE